MNSTNQLLIDDLTLVPLPTWWQNPWVWVVGLLALGLLGWALRRWLRRPLPPVPGVPYAGPYPPATIDEALRRLRELRTRVPQMTDYDLSIQASEILREFIEGKHQVPIRYQTTREFLGLVSAQSEISGPRRVALEQFLVFCDLGKFARQPATVPEMLHAVDTAIQFVVESGKATAATHYSSEGSA